MSTLQQLLTEREAAKLLGVSHRTLQAWRQRQIGPPYLKIGRSVRYNPDGLLKWIQDAEEFASAVAGRKNNAESE